MAAIAFREFLCRDEFDITEAENLMILMKKRLPDYIVKCLLAAGYDELDVICDMKTGETPQNCIEKIERFVNARYSNNKEYNPTLCQPFEFPPGHRARICNFVNELSHLRSKAKQKIIPQKRKHKSRARVSVACKKPRSKNQDDQEPIDLTSSSDCESSDVNVVTVSKQVRTSLRNWAKKQGSGYNQLQEGKDYVLNITPKENPGFFIVALRCAKCNMTIHLHQKNSLSCHSPYLLSNFTRHIKICFCRSFV